MMSSPAQVNKKKTVLWVSFLFLFFYWSEGYLLVVLFWFNQIFLLLYVYIAKKSFVGAITNLEIPKDLPILFCNIVYLDLFSGFPIFI